MIITRTLKDIEVEHIVAEYFNTSIGNVRLKTNEITVGYGPTEHNITEIICEVVCIEDIGEKSPY